MDIVYELGSASAADVRAKMGDPPSYTAVRGLLRVLVDKGQLKIERQGAKYVYRPTVAAPSAGKQMIAHVTRTFFGGSPSRALNALLGDASVQLTSEELERLHQVVSRCKAERDPK